METIAIGSFSGCLAITFCHPIDVIRTRMQVHAIGFTKCVQEIIKNEGYRGFYRGFASPFFAQGLYKAIIFSTNSFTQKYVFHSSNSTTALLASGLIAGTVNALVVAPVEIIRTHQIFSNRNSGAPKLSIFQCAQTIVVTHGPSGLWRGLAPTILRDGPGLGLYFFAFDRFKYIFSGGSSLQPLRTNNAGQVDLPTISLAPRIFAGAMAGFSFWAIALPVDTIKTVIESQTSAAFVSNTTTSTNHSAAAAGRNASISTFTRLKQVTNQLLAEGGIFRLYRAWPVALGRGLPAAAITLTSFDLLSEYVHKS